MYRYLILFLISLSLSSIAQQKPFSKHTFSLGYGYFDILRELNKRQIENEYSVKSGTVYNLKKSLTGPLYFKAETNLSKHIGLVLCIGYEYYSFTGNYEAVRIIDDYDQTTIYIGKPYDELPKGKKSEEHVIVEEKVTYSSWAFALRSNFYLYNRSRFQLYLGAGVGYRTDNNTHTSNLSESFSMDHQLYLMRGTGFQNPVAGELTFGCRGYIWKNLGLYTEIGLAKSLIQAGVSLKLSEKVTD